MQILVVILSVFLAIFLLLGIILFAKLIIISKKIQAMTDRAEKTVNNVSDAVDSAVRFMAPAAIAKFVGEQIRKFTKNK